MKADFVYPIVIEFTGDHGLEYSAREGIDYYNYRVCFNDNDLPTDGGYKILGSIYPYSGDIK